VVDVATSQNSSHDTKPEFPSRRPFGKPRIHEIEVAIIFPARLFTADLNFAEQAAITLLQRIIAKQRKQELRWVMSHRKEREAPFQGLQLGRVRQLGSRIAYSKAYCPLDCGF
jgi:hypothetical protein